MAEFTIRAYRGNDEASLLATWNASMTHDTIDAATFQTKVLLDPNFIPEHMPAAVNLEGRVIGFVLGLLRRVPYYSQGLDAGQGWITAFGVAEQYRRKGIGQALFTQLIERMREAGVRTLSISPYTPNYFIPGVDEGAYPAAIRFLDHLGFTTVQRPISMHANLTGFQIPERIISLEAQREAQDGITIRLVSSHDVPDLMAFLVEHFGWDWYRFAQDYLLEMLGHSPHQICMLVARQHGSVIGYCQMRRERFGPFGVRPDMRNKGIGRIMLFKCLAAMLAKGYHSAWFLWTGDDAARLYRQAGFEQARRFAVMRKQLD